MSDKSKTGVSLIIAFALGAVLGYAFCLGTTPKHEAVSIASTNNHTNDIVVSDASIETASEYASESNSASVPEEVASEPEIVEPVVSGMFSWHKFKEKYLPVLKTYNVNQVYQCFDGQIREGDYDSVRKNLELLSDYDVWLLTGDASWNADDMLEKVNIAKEIGGFAGVVFDVEPKSYDETYLENVKSVCEQTDVPVMFCLSYRADSDIVKEVLSVVDGLLVMNYDVGNEYANIKDWIPVAEQYNVPLITVYELQPENSDLNLESSHTYNGDMDAVMKNFQEQFAGEDNLGIAYHYIKYVNVD